MPDSFKCGRVRMSQHQAQVGCSGLEYCSAKTGEDKLEISSPKASWKESYKNFSYTLPIEGRNVAMQHSEMQKSSSAMGYPDHCDEAAMMQASNNSNSSNNSAPFFNNNFSYSLQNSHNNDAQNVRALDTDTTGAVWQSTFHANLLPQQQQQQSTPIGAQIGVSDQHINNNNSMANPFNAQQQNFFQDGQQPDETQKSIQHLTRFMDVSQEQILAAAANADGLSNSQSFHNQQQQQQQQQRQQQHHNYMQTVDNLQQTQQHQQQQQLPENPFHQMQQGQMQLQQNSQSQSSQNQMQSDKGSLVDQNLQLQKQALQLQLNALNHQQSLNQIQNQESQADTFMQPSSQTLPPLQNYMEQFRAAFNNATFAMPNQQTNNNHDVMQQQQPANGMSDWSDFPIHQQSQRSDQYQNQNHDDQSSNVSLPSSRVSQQQQLLLLQQQQQQMLLQPQNQIQTFAGQTDLSLFAMGAAHTNEHNNDQGQGTGKQSSQGQFSGQNLNGANAHLGNSTTMTNSGQMAFNADRRSSLNNTSGNNRQNQTLTSSSPIGGKATMTGNFDTNAFANINNNNTATAMDDMGAANVSQDSASMMASGMMGKQSPSGMPMTSLQQLKEMQPNPGFVNLNQQQQPSSVAASNIQGQPPSDHPSDTSSLPEGTTPGLKDMFHGKHPGLGPGAVTKRRSSKSKRKKARTFPDKLMTAMVEFSDDRCVSWLPDGKSFVIVDSDSFCEDVLNKVFKECKYASFVRKLHRWGFVRLTSGTGTDCFHHPLFQKGQKDLARKMISTRQDAEPDISLAQARKVDPVAPPSLAGVEKFIRARTIPATPHPVRHQQDSKNL